MNFGRPQRRYQHRDVRFGIESAAVNHFSRNLQASVILAYLQYFLPTFFFCTIFPQPFAETNSLTVTRVVFVRFIQVIMLGMGWKGIELSKKHLYWMSLHCEVEKRIGRKFEIRRSGRVRIWRKYYQLQVFREVCRYLERYERKNIARLIYTVLLTTCIM